MGDRDVRHPPMTAGEQQVWAASYARAFAEARRHSDQDLDAAYHAAQVATRSVIALRHAEIEVTNSFGLGAPITAMTRLMVGKLPWAPLDEGDRG